MRRICLMTIILCKSILSAYGSVDPTEEGKSIADGVFIEKKTLHDEEMFWERSEALPEESLFFDDEDKLYAPPPGESGNPQKIAPLGDYDIEVLLLLSVLSLGYFCRRKRVCI